MSLKFVEVKEVPEYANRYNSLKTELEESMTMNVKIAMIEHAHHYKSATGTKNIPTGSGSIKRIKSIETQLKRGSRSTI